MTVTNVFFLLQNVKHSLNLLMLKEVGTFLSIKLLKHNKMRCRTCLLANGLREIYNWPVAHRGNLLFWKPIIFQNFWAMSFKNHSLTSYQNIYSNISFPKAVNKTCPCGVTIFTSHHKVITSSRSLQTRLLHQGVSRLLRHDDVDQSQTVSKSADFRCEKMHFCSSESRESRIFGISALKTIVFFDLQLVNYQQLIASTLLRSPIPNRLISNNSYWTVILPFTDT